MSPRHLWSPIDIRLVLGLLGLTLLIYVLLPQPPNALFWDENYYIPGADAYLLEAYHLHSHPPLGRLLIAIGKVLWGDLGVHPNSVETRMIIEVPAGFDLRPYRWLPTAISSTAVVPIYLLARYLTNHPLPAAVPALMFLLDNALVVHFRAAMLDGMLYAFLAWGLLATYWVLNSQRVGRSVALSMLGLFLGFAATTKLTGLIGVVVAGFAFLPMIWHESFRAYFQHSALLTLYTAGTVAAVMTVHTSLAVRADLPVAQSYLAQTTVAHRAAVVDSGLSVQKVWQVTAAYWDFMKFDHSNVGPLNPDNPSENGSPAWMWPLGGKAISYRWDTDDMKHFKYLYSVPNLPAWLLSLVSVAYLTVNTINRKVFGGASREAIRHPWVKTAFWTSICLGYGFYMLTMLQVGRVMYLYHYFPALLFGSLLAAKLIDDMIQQSSKWFMTVLGAYLATIFAWFIFMSPFTYHGPLSSDEFKIRSTLSVWGLRCATCH